MVDGITKIYDKFFNIYHDTCKCMICQSDFEQNRVWSTCSHIALKLELLRFMFAPYSVQPTPKSGHLHILRLTDVIWRQRE